MFECGQVWYPVPDANDGNDVAARSLSKAERNLIRKLQVIKIRRVTVRMNSNAEDDPREPLKRDIREDVARLRKSLDAIDATLAAE